MDTLQIAYQILNSLETGKKADYMGVLISPDKLKISEDEWLDVMRSLLDEGYIAGVSIKKDIIGNTNVDIENARITLKGAEYLHHNSAMKRIGRIASNVITIAGSIGEAIK